jgi:hypothetical protein
MMLAAFIVRRFGASVPSGFRGTVAEHSGRTHDAWRLGLRHPSPPVTVARLMSRRSNPTGGSVSKRLTVDCHLGTVRVEAQHRSHFGGLSRRRLVAPHDAVMRLSVDVERPI